MSNEDIFKIIILTATTLSFIIGIIIDTKEKKYILKQTKKIEPRLHEIDSKTKKIKDNLESEVK